MRRGEKMRREKIEKKLEKVVRLLFSLFFLPSHQGMNGGREEGEERKKKEGGEMREVIEERKVSERRTGEGRKSEGRKSERERTDQVWRKNELKRWTIRTRLTTLLSFSLFSFFSLSFHSE